MRLTSLMIGLAVLAVGVPVYGQACAGYPAEKTWLADKPTHPNDKFINEVDGAYLGWGTEGIDGPTTPPVTQTLTTVAGELCQTDTLLAGSSEKLKYRSDGPWSIAHDLEMSIVWRVFISEADTSAPMILLRDGNEGGTLSGPGRQIRINFSKNVPDRTGCVLSGWTADSGATFLSGGKFIPGQPERYLPMSMDAWHTLRMDMHVNGTFDIWIDGGGSDEKHASGTVGTDTSGNRYVQFGRVSSQNGLGEWSTACVAWGVDTEIPAAPAGPDEICNNGTDDDGDGDVDCDDSDCACLADPPECGGPVIEIVDRFNVTFEVVPTGELPLHYDRAGYGAPAFSNDDHSEFQGLFIPSRFAIAPHGENEECVTILQECLWQCLPGDTACEELCNADFDDCDRTRPVKIGLQYDEIPVQCGSTQACYEGVIGTARATTAGELASLPIDWTQPVTVSVETLGSDLSGETVVPPPPDDPIPLPGTGQWRTFVAFDGYTSTPPPVEFEWGLDGETNADSYGDPGDPQPPVEEQYRRASIELDAGQGGVVGSTLVFGIDFDYWDDIGGGPIFLTPDKSSLAWFENLSIEYTWDTAVPVLQVDQLTIGQTTLVNGPTVQVPLVVSNGGPDAGALNYSITDVDRVTAVDATWLSASPSAGALGGGQAQAVTLTFDPTGLGEGLYKARITVDAPGEFGAPRTVYVKMAVVFMIDPPDYDGDGDVDHDDFGKFQACMTGPPPNPGVEPGLCALFADYNQDGYVDQQDVGRFNQCAGGPEVAFDVNCWGQP